MPNQKVTIRLKRFIGRFHFFPESQEQHINPTGIFMAAPRRRERTQLTCIQIHFYAVYASRPKILLFSHLHEATILDTIRSLLFHNLSSKQIRQSSLFHFLLLHFYFDSLSRVMSSSPDWCNGAYAMRTLSMYKVLNCNHKSVSTEFVFQHRLIFGLILYICNIGKGFRAGFVLNLYAMKQILHARICRRKELAFLSMSTISILFNIFGSSLWISLRR